MTGGWRGRVDPAVPTLPRVAPGRRDRPDCDRPDPALTTKAPSVSPSAPLDRNDQILNRESSIRSRLDLLDRETGSTTSEPRGDRTRRSQPMMHAGDQRQRLDTPPKNFLDEQGRYLEGQGRPEPPVAADEAATLLGYLERQRATFAWKCGGLDAAGLGTTVGASAMTLGGMLKHLARFEDDMSTEWLHGRGQLPPWNSVDWDTDSDWDWRTAADETLEQLYARWQDAVVRS